MQGVLSVFMSKSLENNKKRFLLSSFQRSFSWSTGRGDRCDWTMSGTWRALEKRRRWAKATEPHPLFLFLSHVKMWLHFHWPKMLMFKWFILHFCSYTQRCFNCYPKGFHIFTDRLEATVFLCGVILDLFVVFIGRLRHPKTQSALVFSF